MVEETAARPRLGRFVLLEVLGRGAAGVVHAAEDPTLGRRVAIKVLHGSGGDDEAAAARLLREAKALARVAHPNVVAIHETGIDGGRVYVVMELVAGRTARDWVAATPRTRAEILDVYRQAGRGLSAAHAAGLVHRDVKPENILVGDDGRTRVTDFGLVAALEGERDVAEPTDDDVPDVLTLTRTGMLIGTPAYMSPEGHLREPLDAASDQFSLCVALWEALTGARPFPSKSYRELSRAVIRGEIVGGDALPERVRATLRRGLDPDRGARWPSVDALWAALDHAPAAPRSRRTAWVGTAASGVVATGALAIWAPWRGTAAPPAPADARVSPDARVVVAPLRLTEPGGSPYSPVFVDDRTLVYDDRGGGGADLFKLNLGGKPERLVATGDIEWNAARGRRPGEVAFATVLDTGPVITFVDVATGVVERTSLRTNVAIGTSDGLFYARFDGVEVRRLRDGRDEVVKLLPDGRNGFAYVATADGRRVALIQGGERNQIALCTLDPATTELACRADRAFLPARPAFALDGVTLYAATMEGIVRIDPSGELTMVIPDVIANGGLALSPDGTHLAYSDADALKYVRPIGGEVLFHGPIADLSIGRDDVFVYVRDVPGGRAIVRRDAAGERELTPANLGWVGHPAISPDGGRVAFKLDGPNGGIRVVDITPFSPEPITTVGTDSNPVWLADGRLAFNRWSAEGRPTVMIVDPAEGIDGDAARRPAHPSARVLADRVAATGELILRSVDYFHVYLWDPVTGHERELSTEPAPRATTIFPPVATPDGAWVIVTYGQWGERMWRIPIPSGPRDRRVAELLHTLPEGDVGERPMVRADGTVLVTNAHWVGDLWIVEL